MTGSVAAVPKSFRVGTKRHRFRRPFRLPVHGMAFSNIVGRKASMPARSSSRYNPGENNKMSNTGTITGADQPLTGASMKKLRNSAIMENWISASTAKGGIGCLHSRGHPSNFVGGGNKRTPEQQAERRRVISEFILSTKDSGLGATGSSNA